MSKNDGMKFSFPIGDAVESYTKELKFANDWRILFFWLGNSPFPQSVKVRAKTRNDDVIVRVKLGLLKNGETICKKKFMHLMESKLESITIKLDNSKTCFGTFTSLSSFLLKGSVEISPVRGDFISTPYRKDLESLSRDLAKLTHPQTSCVAPDVNLKCGSTSIPAHKVILCARSPVFAAMFDSPMRENAENQVDITDIGEPILRTMVAYMYTGVVEKMESASPQKMTASTALELLVAADKYELRGLKIICSNFLKENVSTENVIMLVDVGNAVSQDLKCFAMDYIFKCSDFSAVQTSEAWKTLEISKPLLAIEILSSVVKSKDERIKRLKTH